MAVINKIQIDGVTYDIQDANLQAEVDELETDVVAATDEEILAALYS